MLRLLSPVTEFALLGLWFYAANGDSLDNDSYSYLDLAAHVINFSISAKQVAAYKSKDHKHDKDDDMNKRMPKKDTEFEEPAL